MYAIVQCGGKQFKVSPGEKIRVEKLDLDVGAMVELDALMFADDNGKVQIGKPLLDAKVDAKVLEHGKGDKVIVFHYAAKKNRRKKQGHRQPYTELEIVSDS